MISEDANTPIYEVPEHEETLHDNTSDENTRVEPEEEINKL